ncbi:E3 ubiquitin-protein ligase rnf213-beta isoform X1 [Lepisosteus oculatus]|uniref:E3 ubiquitin-protein ligase rnf213-beta isoform X1 n=1 Tax=Lepisosteus oculatus TaxID=7918 RepID=UPI00371A1D0A
MSKPPGDQPQGQAVGKEHGDLVLEPDTCGASGESNWRERKKKDSEVPAVPGPQVKISQGSLVEEGGSKEQSPATQTGCEMEDQSRMDTPHHLELMEVSSVGGAKRNPETRGGCSEGEAIVLVGNGNPTAKESSTPEEGTVTIKPSASSDGHEPGKSSGRRQRKKEKKKLKAIERKGNTKPAAALIDKTQGKEEEQSGNTKGTQTEDRKEEAEMTKTQPEKRQLRTKDKSVQTQPKKLKTQETQTDPMPELARNMQEKTEQEQAETTGTAQQAGQSEFSGTRRKKARNSETGRLQVGSEDSASAAADAQRQQEAKPESTVTAEARQPSKDSGKESKDLKEHEKSSEEISNQTTAKEKQCQEKASQKLSTGKNPRDAHIFTIYINAVLDKKIKFKTQSDKLLLLYSNRSVDLQINYFRRLGKQGYLIEAQVSVEKQFLTRGEIQYKYAVMKRGNRIDEMAHHRKLIPFDWQLNEVHLYEGHVHFNSLTYVEWFFGLFKSKEEWILMARLDAGDVLLHRIFEKLVPSERESITWFIEHLQALMWQIKTASQRELYPDIHYCQPTDLSQCIVKHVLQLLQRGSDQSTAMHNPLVLGFIVFQVSCACELQLAAKDWAAVCRLLCFSSAQNSSHLVELKSLFQNCRHIVIGLMNRCARSMVVELPLLVPLLHALREPSEGGTRAERGRIPEERDWAGLEGVDFSIYRRLIRSLSDKRRMMLDLMDAHKSLGGESPQVLHSWLSLVATEDIPKYSRMMGTALEHVVQSLHYRLKECEIRTLDKDVPAVGETIEHMLEKLEEEKERILSSGWLDYILMCCINNHKSVCKMARLVPHYKVAVASFQLVLKVAEIQDSFLGKDCEGDSSERSRLLEKLSGLQSELLQWRESLLQLPLFSRERRRLSYPKEPELWDSLLGVKCAIQPLSDQWRGAVEKDLRKRICQAGDLQSIAVCCCEQSALSKTCPTVQTCFRELCQSAIQVVCQNEKEGELLHFLNPFSMEIPSPILSSIILESTAKAGEDLTGLLLSRQSSLSYLLSQGVWQKLQVDEKALQTLERGHSALASLVEGLLLGTIPLGHLTIILQNEDHFKKLYHQQNKLSKQDFFHGSAEKMLRQREADLQAFNQVKEHMDNLIKMISRISESVTVEDLRHLKQQHRAELQSVSLGDLVEVEVHRPELELHEQASRAVKWYIVCDMVRDMAREMHQLRDSTLLLSLWVQMAVSMKDGQLTSIMTLRKVQTDIWKPLLLQYRQLGLKIARGTVTFQELDKALQESGDRGEGAEMKRELQLMASLLEDEGLDVEWTQTRLTQIQQYRQLHAAAWSASAVLRIAQKLELSGDFTQIESLTQLREDSFKKRNLKSLTSELICAKEQLAGVTEKHTICLEEFLNCQSLVNWVKINLEGMSDLKVFVDLASISAGENDSEIDRVACFHDAVMGYSPFLYSLKSSDNFERFMACAEKVWEALRRDEKLPEKLRDSTRWLDWLKGLRETHGSVEQSSLSLATAINTEGVYQVGKLHSQQGKQSLQSVLEVAVKKDSVEKSYSLEELLELQNKLMLMSSKGEHGRTQVNRFMQVFEGVQRLGRILLQLHSSGNMLFREWKAFIHCNQDYQPCIKVHFAMPMMEAIEYSGELEEQLQEVCRSVEFCHRDWCTFISEMRSQFYPLNYYTSEQIVYLCHQLHNCHTKKLPQQVLALLSFVKPGCTLKDIRVACSTTPEVSSEPSTEDENSISSEHESAGSRHEEEPTKVIDYSDDEVEDDYNFDVVYNSDYEEEMVSLEHFSDEEKQWEAEIEMSMHLSGKEACVKEDPIETVEDLWKHFKENMAGSLSEHLDIITLGQFLSCLSDINKQEIKRKLCPVLQEGKPNLVLCPESDVLSTALSLYVTSPDQPLPSSDELLLCREDTTAEVVEIFLRRALGQGRPHDQEKIFTLVNPGLLTYDVGVTVGEQFEALERSSHPKYHLLIVSSVKHQHRYVPSFFSNCKVQAGVAVSTEKAKSYLKRHFTVKLEKSHVLHAYPEHLSTWVVSSTRPAVGKSLYVTRLFERFQEMSSGAQLVRIRLIEPRIDPDLFLKSLTDGLVPLKEHDSAVVHIDVAAVRTGLEVFLFEVLVLGCLTNSEGKLWRRNPAHLFLIELLRTGSTRQIHAEQSKQGLLDILPTILCRPPKEVRTLELMRRQGTLQRSLDPLMDMQVFASDGVQRPYQYLKRYNGKQSLDDFTYQKGFIEGDPSDCLYYLLAYCGVKDPSWTELQNFTWFLNLQLNDCENSLFCDPVFVGNHLLGFKSFIVKFMILMARDFATPSMDVSDQSPTFSSTDEDNDILAQLTIRKRWESESHPYVFFNADHFTMSFLGFHVKRKHSGACDAVDPHTGEVLMGNVMSSELLEGLQRQGISLSEDFDALPREDKIQRLSFVVGAKKGWIKGQFDPDPTYELTADNVMKMLAIHMRFRCEIPVIIMGETGCGKTRLVRFLCDLQKGGHTTENMKLVKVHGGTTAEMIYQKVEEAQILAKKNKKQFELDTVLFFDEANTTESIFAIKEVLCDRTVRGQPLKPNTGLKIVAACNPYRKHSPEMIRRLELAGLGYRVKAGETEDRLGNVPLRQLVYRVQPLPPSMVPLVWDFGQLSDFAELSYTRQIVQRQARDHALPPTCTETVSAVLAASQRFMRSRRDECSFVSLRDVERSMKVLIWFYHHSSLVFHNYDHLNSNEKILKCLALAVGVCYYPSLVSKREYLNCIYRFFPEPLNRPDFIEKEISSCQDVFLENIKTRDTVAKNKALKENVFLMVICIELRIPLFLVGKPGSSKSLAKTVVADAMQGQASHCSLFKNLKQVHMVSFQCSPHSSPEGIIGTFWQCARFQQGKSLKEYVSVVVLDEIGLAEDSPQMPLKTLHPLLEDGCIDNDRPKPHMKVGFVGISNWALDPAKMNRGIFVSRWDPSEHELVETAKGICSSDNTVLIKIQHLFPKLASAFLGICKEVECNQFFGLRDYYSLIKMICALVKASQEEPTESQLAEAILRNFSGRLEEFDPLNYFQDIFQDPRKVTRPSTLWMVEKNLDYRNQEESRYLLLLTTNNAALHILQQSIFSKKDRNPPEIVFGSGFPKDQEYAQVCRNVNRVKTCMETGRTVILLNLQNLYESLYDALNQYYVYLGGQQYVDLGLGTHRVKCRVHRDFRLVVVEDQNKVYTQFPVPLINRLEKHQVDRRADLTTYQKRVLKKLKDWVQEFIFVDGERKEFHPHDVFIGFHEDACASAVLQAMECRHQWRDKEVEGLQEDLSVQEQSQGTGTDVEMEEHGEFGGSFEDTIGESQKCDTGDSGVQAEEQNDEPLEEQIDIEMKGREGGDPIAKVKNEQQMEEEGSERVMEENESMMEEGGIVKCSEEMEEDEVLEAAKCFLLSCATPDSVLRLKYSELSSQEKKMLQRMYFRQQHHLSLRDFMENHMNKTEDPNRFIEVTTYSSLLTQSDVRAVAQALSLDTSGILLLSLHQFDTESSFCSKIRNFLREDRASLRVLLVQTDVEESAHCDELIASAKYCAMNEMSSVGTRMSQCYMVFITKLSRIAGDSQYIGFQGGRWLSVHIDDLRDTEDMSSDLSAFCGFPISELLTSSSQPEQAGSLGDSITENQKGSSAHLDCVSLLKSCVQSAVALLRDTDDRASRSMECVQILLGLMGKKQGTPEVRFVQVLLQRLSQMLALKEEMVPSPEEWVSKEAKKRQALQEGGTLRHTVWRCLQATITPVLARTVEVLDRDFNLDLLQKSEPGNWLTQMWIDILEDHQILEDHLILPQNQSVVNEEIPVQRHLWLGKQAQPCAAPFSWLIRLQCESIWEESYYVPGTEEDSGQRILQFVNSFKSSRLGSYITKLAEEEQRELGHRFLKDFLLLSINISSQEELKVFTRAVLNCVSELQQETKVSSDLSPAWIVAAFRHFGPRLVNLSHILQLQPHVTRILLEGAQSGSPEMNEDVVALGVYAEAIERHATGTLQECRSLLQSVRQLQSCVERACGQNYSTLCSPGCLKQLDTIRSLWQGVLVIAAFIQQVVVRVSMTGNQRLEALALKHCTLLHKFMQGSPELRNRDALQGLMRVLHSCNEQSSHLDFRYGIQKCPVCLLAVSEPAILPCEHVFCLTCIQHSIDGDRLFCPQCKTGLPADYQPAVSDKLKGALQHHEILRRQCNCFFLEVVSRFCLAEETCPEEGVVELLFSLLISAQGAVYRTRELSPFLECVDHSPVVRSVLPKLLLHYSFEQVKGHIQRYLQNLERNVLDREDLTELYLLFVNCFQDALLSPGQEEGHVSQKQLQGATHFLSRVARRQTAGFQEDPAEFIQTMARLRLYLGTASSFLKNTWANPGSELVEGYLQQVRAVCEYSRNDWYRVYLLRAVNRLAGMDCVQALLRDAHWHWIFPAQVIELQSHAPAEVDRFLCCGPHYKALRDDLCGALLQSQTDPITAALQELDCSSSTAPVLLSLSLFRQVTCLYVSSDPRLQPKPEETGLLQDFMRISPLHLSREYQEFCSALLTNELGGRGSSLSITPALSAQRRTLLEILVHAAAIFLTGNHLLSPLQQIASRTQTMKDAFLPTMPDDHSAEVHRWMKEKLHSYRCVNGHVCFVGECGRPVVTSVCLDCGAPIGGIRHNPVEGFIRADIIEDQTRTGHVLGEAHVRSDVPDRQISLAAFSILRLLTHLAMLLGAHCSLQGIRDMIYPRVMDVVPFLWRHLEKDMTVLGKALDKNMDDTAITVHLVIHAFLGCTRGSSDMSRALSSKQARQQWEKLVCNAVIKPVLQDLEQKLTQAHGQISADDRLSGSVLMKVLYGNPVSILTLPSDSPTDNSRFWTCPERLTLERFTQVLDQSGGWEGYPLLWLFLKKAHCIRHLSHLPELAALQTDLLRMFPHVTVVGSQSITQILQQLPTGYQKKVLKRRVKVFINVWNQLRTEIANSKETGVQQELCEADLSTDSSAGFLSLCRRGPGSCLSTLIDFLTETHNSLVREARKEAPETDSNYTVSLEGASETQLALCHPERELLPLVLAHCHYTLKKGQQTVSSFDMQGIENQLSRSFLAGKPLIMTNTSKYLNRHQQDFSQILAGVRAKIPQEPLKGSVSSAMKTVLRSYTDVCDAVFAVEIGLRFLGKTGGEAKAPLLPYLRNMLKMGKQVSSTVAKALNECWLQHITSVWQLLTSWKSELMLQKGKDPFERLPREYQQRLTEEEMRGLRAFLRVTDISTFNLELHEILLLKTNNPNPETNYQPHWDLCSTLENHLENKHCPALPGLEALSDSLTLNKGPDIWRLAVKFRS